LRTERYRIYRWRSVSSGVSSTYGVSVTSIAHVRGRSYH